MLITKSRHEAVVADLERQIEHLTVLLSSKQKTMERVFTANLRLATENERLRKPPRDALGRFVKWEKI
jgi:regulator of replication initiation timing